MRSTPSPRAGVVVPFVQRLLAVFLTVAFAAAFGSSASAQSADRGTIRGKVQNASNGAFIENATVTIDGTSHRVLSDAFGEFVLRDVPAGEVTLRAAYVGEPEQVAKVKVAAGAEATQDFTFRQSAALKKAEDGTLVLDPFKVNAERFNNARAIATAEERTSINIKNVVAIDQFGYIPSGNVGEFAKFLPGVQIDYGPSNGNNQGYSENTANGISVRGFGPEDTAILIDGLPVSSTLPGNLTRQVGLDQLSINNAERVELIKVATPDMPANSVGGQVNLVTRSAFEYAHPTYSTRLFFNFNSLNSDLKKTPGPTNKETWKTTPGVEVNATYPIRKNLGVSFTGYWAKEFSQSYRAQPVWNNNHASNYQSGAFTNAAGQASSTANPVLTRYQITDSPSLTERRSGNIRLDWRPTPNQLLRTNFQYSRYSTNEAQRRLDFRPTIANGIVWDSTQVVGNMANSTTAMTVTTRDRIGDTKTGQLQYSANVFGFNLAAAGSLSVSQSDFVDAGNGHYSEIALNLNPSRVSLFGIDEGIPSRAQTFARTTGNPEVDYTQLANWVFDGTTAKSGESHNERRIGLYKVDLERPLDFLHFLGTNSLSVKAGYRRDEDKNVKSGRGTGYREILRPGASYTVGDIVDTNYTGQSPGFGLAAQQWASTYRLYQLNQTNNLFYVPDFDEATNTRVENYNSYVGQQKNTKETVNAWYGMLNGSFFNDRLSFAGGLRQETKDLVGRSPFTDSKWNYVRNKDGSLYTDAANPNGVTTNSATSVLFATTAAGTTLRQNLTSAGISFPTTPYGSPTGASASLVSRMLNYQPLHPVNEHKKGDPSYSLNTVFRATKNLDLKVAYSRSFKLPSLEAGASGGLLSGTTNFTFTEYTQSEQSSQQGAKGQITVANPGLKPETSNNWDFETSYYTDSGGKLTVAYWRKEITNQNMNYTTYSGTPTFDSVVSALGLDPAQYDDWRVVTSTNSKTKQKPSGWEFEVRQDLRFFGEWGRRIQGFVSYAVNSQPDPESPAPYTIVSPNGTTTTLTPAVNTITKRANRFGGAGIQYSGDRFVAQIRGTYRNANELGANRIALINGNFLRRFQPAETRVDVSLSYLLTRRYQTSLFLSGRDVFNGQRDEEWHDDQGLLPGFAQLADRKKFGVSWTAGISAAW
jgi:TonB-dependent receptor